MRMPANKSYPTYIYILHISYTYIFSSHVFEIYARSRVKWKMCMSERVRIQIHKCIPANKSCPAMILRGHLIPLSTDCVPLQQHYESFHWLCTFTTALWVISLIVHLDNSTMCYLTGNAVISLVMHLHTSTIRYRIDALPWQQHNVLSHRCAPSQQNNAGSHW